MKKIFTLLLLAGLGNGWANAQCVENEKNSVLLAGDSWAFFQLVDGTLNTGLKNIGHSDKRVITSAVVAENGAETDDFMGQEKQDAIQELMDQNPDIEIIHISIGGNDVLGDWNVNFTQQQTDSLEANVAQRLETVVEFLKTTRPGVNVFWPGYCYPNFEEVISDLPPEFTDAYPFTDLWNSMGRPSFLELNTVLNDFSDSVAAYFAPDPFLHFVPAQGVLQNHFGQEQAMNVSPTGTYLPFEAPLPLGYPEYPSPKESMRLYVTIPIIDVDIPDSFHLSAEAYRVLFKYQAEKYHQKALMDDMYKRSTGGSADGSVSSSGNISQEIKVGEEASNEVSAILTFDLTGMADTTLQGASIFLRRESLTGQDPFDVDLQIKMANGFFGSNIDVEGSDFAESGDVVGNVCVFGSREKDGHWLRLDLTAEMLANIGNQDQVQFQISAPGFTGGVMAFHDASDPDKAPILNLNYGPAPASVQEFRAIRELSVYPIPTDGELTIDLNPTELISLDVINVLGSVVLTPTVNDNRIDISDLPTGSYILRITTNEGISTKRIIKR